MDFQGAFDLVVFILAFKTGRLSEVENVGDFDPIAVIDIDEAHAFQPALGDLPFDLRLQAFGRGRGARRAKNRRANRTPNRADPHANLLLFGNPLGASRPASARLPRQSRSSVLGSFWVRPAGSSQVRPASSLKTLASESLPSL